MIRACSAGKSSSQNGSNLSRASRTSASLIASGLLAGASAFGECGGLSLPRITAALAAASSGTRRGWSHVEEQQAGHLSPVINFKVVYEPKPGT